MQLSRYLKVYPCRERAGYLLLFSTKKASKILIKKETYHAMKKGLLSPSDEALLSRLGFIVEDREAEKRAMLNFFDDANSRDPVLNIIVVLNLDCNFSCIYCYEGDMKGKLYMSDETAGGLIDFIKERFTEDKKTLLIDFYGGEPLLSIGLIKSISGALKPFCERRGASYTFTLVTNGSLFTKRVAEQLVPLGLKRVKITLDGPAEIHNRYRPFKSGAGSFDTIIGNIKDTCDLVKIGIGGNFEKNNYKKFPLLLDYLLREGLTPDSIPSIKFYPVIKRPAGDLSPTDYKGGCMSVNEPWIVEAEAGLREEILRRGYKTPKLAPILCMVETTDAYVVNFDGVIYKCPAFIGKEGFEVGDVQTGVKDYSAIYKLGIWKNEDCARCEYLPLCFGGCRYMTFVRDGNIERLDCQKDYLDASLETLIKQDIKYGL
ncbi:MAG: geopeptide radical SAM maturase [Deltaproteobacteria bacterium]|nr:geopeptide radical SAM maturase [Deltaproteobacteria bacterium]